MKLQHMRLDAAYGGSSVSSRSILIWCVHLLTCLLSKGQFSKGSPNWEDKDVVGCAGLRSVSVAWGAWASGMAADAAMLRRFERMGMGAIAPADGLGALSLVCSDASTPPEVISISQSKRCMLQQTIM